MTTETEKPMQLSPLLWEITFSVVVGGLSTVASWFLGVANGVDVGILFAVIVAVTFVAFKYMKPKT